MVDSFGLYFRAIFVAGWGRFLTIMKKKGKNGARQTGCRRVFLNLHLLEAVLPDNDVRGGAVLAVVEEDDPVALQSVICLHR
jgi:hypothetical protein